MVLSKKTLSGNWANWRESQKNDQLSLSARTVDIISMVEYQTLKHWSEETLTLGRKRKNLPKGKNWENKN